MNVQGCSMHCLSRLASQTKYTDTESGIISKPFESLQKFQGRSAVLFTSKDEVKTKYFLKVCFSQTLIFTGYFIHRSSVCKLIEFMLLASDFIANCTGKET